MPDEVIATLTPRGARRWVGVGLQAMLGAVLLSLAVRMPPGQGAWAALLAVCGAVALFGTWRLHAATGRRVELTRDALRDSSGAVLARVDEIAAIDRGAFAFKPSNGFLLRLARPGAAAWQPGLWWRAGRYVGVGGVTPRHEAKLMAEIIAGLVAERRGD